MGSIEGGYVKATNELPLANLPPLLLRLSWRAPKEIRAPKHKVNVRILQTMISGIPIILGLGTITSDPHVDVVFWVPGEGTPRQFQHAGSVHVESHRPVTIKSYLQ